MVFFALDTVENVCPKKIDEVMSYNSHLDAAKSFLTSRFELNETEDVMTLIPDLFYTNAPFSWLRNATSYQIMAIIYLTTSTVYLTLRELVQMFMLYHSKLDYFKKKSNIMEILLISSSWWFLLMILMYSNFYRKPAAFIILLASIEILIVLPTTSLSNYMLMLRKVSETFLKFFTIFAIIILAFTFSFYALFRPIRDNFQKSTSCHNALHSNYEEPFEAFLKTTFMFAGKIY